MPAMLFGAFDMLQDRCDGTREEMKSEFDVQK